jgi:DNA-binding NarL/FixJ family response regulator
MRVLLADDQAKVHSALRLLLGEQPGWRIVGEVVNARALATALRAACPDVVLLDWGLPRLTRAGGISAL